MFKSRTFTSFLVVITALFMSVWASASYADDFQFAALRFDRLSANQTDVPVLVVIEPSTLTDSRTETTFRITFDDALTVGTASEITTSTASIPSTFKGNSLTAMPGLSSTATLVSGQQVNFSISDLTDGNYYAFYITAGIDTGSAGNYESIIETRDGGGMIDIKTIGTTIIPDDEVVVTATVPAGTNIADVNIDGDIDAYATLQQGDEVTITVSYRLNVGSARPFRLRAYWDDPVYVGNESHSADAIQYVDGSAKKTSDGTSPVIDLQNNLIQWNIGLLQPTSEYKTVTFKLRVRENLGVTQKLKALIFADGEYEGTGITRDEFGFYILKVPSTTTATPTPTPAPDVSIPIVEETPFTIEDMQVTQVSTSVASLHVITNEKSHIRVLYGTSEDNLSAEIEDETSVTNHGVVLTDLNPDTRYYFKVIASEVTDESILTGRIITSDIYTFKTTAVTSRINFGTAMITWKEIALAETDVNSLTQETVLLMAGNPIEFNLSAENPQDMQSARLTFVPKADVLGITNAEPNPPEYSVALIETARGVYSGEVIAVYEVGEYVVKLEVRDVYGSLFTQYLPFIIFTSEPITVTNQSNGKGIEAARVFVERFNSVTGMYEDVAQSFTYNNRTDEDGYLALNLPKAQYRFTVDAPGYAREQQFITIDAQTYSYPTVALEPNWGVSAYITFVATTIQDIIKFTADSFQQLTSSYRVRLLAILVFILSAGANLFTVVMKKHRHERATSTLPRARKIFFVVAKDSVYVVNILLVAAGGVYTGAHVYYVGLSASLMLMLFFIVYVMSFAWIVHVDLYMQAYRRLSQSPKEINSSSIEESTSENISS